MQYVQYKRIWYSIHVMKQTQNPFTEDCFPICSLSKHCSKGEKGTALCVDSEKLWNIVNKHHEYGQNTLVYFVESGVHTLLKELKKK